MNREEINKRFDERFDGIYYGKDFDGSPNYPPEPFKEDVKSFLHQQIERAVAEREKEIVEKVERIKLDMDVVVCDCGEPYKDSDPAILVNELFSLLTKKK